MKKQIMTAILLSAVLCLGSCSLSINVGKSEPDKSSSSASSDSSSSKDGDGEASGTSKPQTTEKPQTTDKPDSSTSSQSESTDDSESSFKGALSESQITQLWEIIQGYWSCTNNPQEFIYLSFEEGTEKPTFFSALWESGGFFVATVTYVEVDTPGIYNVVIHYDEVEESEMFDYQPARDEEIILNATKMNADTRLLNFSSSSMPSCDYEFSGITDKEAFDFYRDKMGY